MDIPLDRYFQKRDGEFGHKPRERRTIIDPVRPIYYSQSHENIYKQGMTIKNDIARALYFFIYLTGCRINEATDFTPSKMAVLPNGIKIRTKTEKARIAIRKTREVFIPLGKNSKCLENEMWNEVKSYIQNLDSGDYAFRKWKNMSNFMARNHKLETDAMIKENKGYVERRIKKNMHPHYLRHCRATHLTEIYGFNDTALCHFFGWANRNMASRYAKLRDIESSFRGNV